MKQFNLEKASYMAGKYSTSWAAYSTISWVRGLYEKELRWLSEAYFPPQLGVLFHFRNHGVLLRVGDSQVLLQQRIQIYVHVFGVSGRLVAQSVSYLGVEHSLAVDAELFD